MSKTVALWLSSIALGLGLLVGFMPTDAAGANCGSAFVESNNALINDDCDRQTSLLRIPAIGLTAAGALGLFSLWVDRPAKPHKPLRGVTVINERDQDS